MYLPGVSELVILLALILFLFPRRLHQTARSLGQCLGLVRSGTRHITGDDDDE